MNWKPAPVFNSAEQIHHGSNPNNPGVYWVQLRTGLAHLTVRYTTSYWNGKDWNIACWDDIYFWTVIEQAPEPENPIYYDELGRLDIVPAQERGVELETPIGKA